MGKSKKETFKTRQIRISNYAYQSIDEIITYIAFIKQQPLTAVKVSVAIENTISRIAENPFAFRECEQIPTKTKIYRRAVCLSWLIIYKITNAEIIIISVIHRARSRSKISKLRKIK